jgi:type I restriction enzyme R subunit
VIHENQIEKDFIDILTLRENQWTYRNDIKTETALWDNLRSHINRINVAKLDGISLSDNEFSRLVVEFKRLTATPFGASQWLRGENGTASIKIERDDTSRVSLVLFSNKDIAGGISSYEVVNQITPDADKNMRGDVTLLINGLPIIHIELKAEYAKDGYLQAFDQIKRYAETGFFNGIYAATQIFVVSNKVSTKYFARPGANDAKSFERAREFLFNWRTADNEPVENLYDFTRQVLRIPDAHELVSRYTILVDDKKNQKFLMVLRSYQIHAIKKITKQASSHEGGFVWHATGSGKTITSFVATKLLAQAATGVVRTVMIVDRKDLDSQTKGEFSKFASEYHTGQVRGKGEVTDNTLIVGVSNRNQLSRALLSGKNNNTIIVTTIQKLSAAIRDVEKKESNKFEKLRGEHIAFIVDECHRAVSDEEMKHIKQIFPNSTWFGFTGTPIFEDNQKQENGTFARTTSQQYGIGKDGKPLPNGGLLHAYTTKNAMDDGAVLGFSTEYHCLLNIDSKDEVLHSKVREKYPKADAAQKLSYMTEIEKEALLERDLFECDDYIETMLKKIFKRQSVIEKFKVINGMPTMSAILTTHSIAQAKRIYSKLQELRQAGELLNGKELDERYTLRDSDFPRVAITFSLSSEQGEVNAETEEMNAIIDDYNAVFGTNANIDNYNENINKRLARKEAQYQKDGQWLDFVIVVDRLLTGFDAPTIQTLYVDRDLKWQKLLQAFSRTNRLHPGKEVGMIVTFRKPATMRQNVEDSIRLFSNEDKDWNELVPREYEEVKDEFNAAYKALTETQEELEKDLQNVKKKVEQVRAFQKLEKAYSAIRSYEDFAEEGEQEQLVPIVETIHVQRGHIENLKGEIKEALSGDADAEELLNEIEFTTGNRAVYEEKIDSYYINKLLGDLQKSTSQSEKDELKEKISEIIDSKEPIVKEIYTIILADIEQKCMTGEWQDYFTREIDGIISRAAAKLQIPSANLHTSFNEYNRGKNIVPYINVIIENTQLDKDSFEADFGEKYRNRSRVIEGYWRSIIENELLPLKEELL